MMQNTEVITTKIREIVEQYPYFGYRRIHAILKHRYGFGTHRNKVYRIMKEQQLCLPVITSKKQLFKGIPIALNVATDASNTLWGIDMTYIWCGRDGWGYFHGVIDHYDKTLLGYHFSRSCKAVGGVMALAEAATGRNVDSLELRSDNGCHYGAKIFRDEIRRLGITQTRTMVNTPKGNAVIERFFKSLKQECVWQNQFENFEQAKIAVATWVDFYNNKRPHQTLNYSTPCAFYESEGVRKIS